MATTSTFSHGYALIIGIGGNLPVTIEDAKALYKILTDPSRAGYSKEHVKCLTGKSATRDAILVELDRLAKFAALDPKATVVVYFSGHGGLLPSFHLVPWGYDSRRLVNTAISGEEFTNKLKNINSQKLLVLLDCCHAGGMVELKSTEFVQSPLPPEIDTILTPGSGRVVIASSRKDEYSFAGKPYSKFTQALIEGLSGYGAAERDGLSYMADIAVYIGRMVPNRTEDSQHPILKLAGADNFPVCYYAGGETSPKQLPDADSEILPLDALTDEAVSRLVKKLYSAFRDLLSIEEQLSDMVNQSDIPNNLINKKNEIIQSIHQIELEIASEAILARDQNVMALGRRSIAAKAKDGSRITIRSSVSPQDEERSSTSQSPAVIPISDGSNIVAAQDDSIAADATGKSEIEIDKT